MFGVFGLILETANQPTYYQPIATLIQAVFTLIVGIGVGTVAFMQWKVARDKLRLDLFDRRYKVFEAFRKYLVSAVNKPIFDFQDEIDFNIGTADAEFLFGSAVTDYFKEVRSHVGKMDTHRKSYQNLPVGDQRSRAVDAESKERLWLINQFKEMSKVFAPYLSYSNIKSDSELVGIRALLKRLCDYIDAKDSK